MTWAGEAGAQSGLFVWTNDGSPDKLTGIPGQVVIFDNNSVPKTYNQAALTGVEPLSINQIGDVNTFGVVTGGFLGWNGSQWVPLTPTGAGGSRAYATGSINTTATSSTTYVSVPNSILTIPSGSWHCLFSAGAGHNKNAQLVEAAIFFNGVEVIQSARGIGGQADNRGNFNVQGLVSGSGVVEVRYRQTSGAGGGPLGTIYRRLLVINEIDIMTNG